MEKTIFEKRFDTSLKRYEKMTKEQLKEIELEQQKTIYDGLTTKEIIDAELIIIEENIYDEITFKQLSKKELDDYIKFINIIKRIQQKIENTDLTQETEDEIKQILTILQLSLNIKPCFITCIIYLNQINFYEKLISFIEKNKTIIKEKKEPKWII